MGFIPVTAVVICFNCSTLKPKRGLDRFEKRKCKFGYAKIEYNEKRRNENEFGVVF